MLQWISIVLLTFQNSVRSNLEPSAGMKKVLIWKPDSCASFAKTRATDCCCLFPCKGSSLSVMRKRERLERLEDLQNIGLKATSGDLSITIRLTKDVPISK